MKDKTISEFANFCEAGNTEELYYLLKKENDIDVNYQNGYFGVLAAMNGNVEVLKFLSKHGADMHIDNEAMLKNAAHNGHINCVNYLLEKHNANPLELLNTTAYNNYQEVENIFNQYLEGHKVDISGDIHSTIEI